MKKLLSILLICLVLFGCSKKQEKPDLSKEFVIETYKADMSGYENLKSSGHMFVGTTVSELKRTVDEGGYGVFVLSRTGCHSCQLAMQYLNEVAQELGVYVYYIDAQSDAYPILGTDNYDILYEVLYETIPENENGERDLQTPEVVTIVDGKITGSQIGTTWGGSNYTDKDVTKLEDIYRKLLTPFVQESQDQYYTLTCI